MKFAVGYQVPDNGEGFCEIVKNYHDSIAELYFAWTGQPSGRAKLGEKRGLIDWTAQERLEYELVEIKKLGVKLDILFNSNCYGAHAVSAKLENEVVSILEHLADTVGGVDIVTTTSLAVARTVKKFFPNIEVRASVNMRIGNVNSMSYVSGLFDSFYIQRDFQRNINYVRDVKQWCSKNGKSLFMLANSGCLFCCPGQSFHDNLVAHDAEIDETKNIENWTPHVCWNLYKKRENWPAILQSTWIRPEDIHNYEGIIPVMKLATRMHSHPRMVIGAYANQSFSGNLLDLFEPGFSSAFSPYYIDNKSFPDDFFEKTSTCSKNCEICKYCADALEKVIKTTP
ncbi:MAG: hypothetical protein A2020_10460 [Lentisphaerae bacterium GWF2_45_14]|nr:MAG: hypothetical protein A2020_10460 [Lentisphaerae bacterium GWF2_45_14]